MDDRYPVDIGYPDANKSGMRESPRLSAHLSVARFRTWRELMDLLSRVDQAMHKESVAECTSTMPPVGQILILTDVVIHQRVDKDPDGYVTHFGPLSYSSITRMIQWMNLNAAVENELEAEQRETRTS